MTDQPPLRPLHSELVALKVQLFEKIQTEQLLESLAPGQEHCLKTRQDGTMLDGHHRIYVLRSRGIDVDRLPREVVPKDE